MVDQNGNYGLKLNQSGEIQHFYDVDQAMHD